MFVKFFHCHFTSGLQEMQSVIVIDRFAGNQSACGGGLHRTSESRESAPQCGRREQVQHGCGRSQEGGRTAEHHH